MFGNRKYFTNEKSFIFSCGNNIWYSSQNAYLICTTKIVSEVNIIKMTPSILKLYANGFTIFELTLKSLQKELVRPTPFLKKMF